MPVNQDLTPDLVDAFRLFHYFKMDDLVYTHLSIRDPTDPEYYWVNRRAILFVHISAKDLVRLRIGAPKINPDEVLETAHEIHGPIYGGRPDVNCVMHLHPPFGSTFSTLNQQLLMIHQFSLQFAGHRIAYIPYDGLVTEAQKGELLAQQMQMAQVAVMRNHGLLSTGATVREAFARMYYLEQACRIQIQSSIHSDDLIIIDNKLAEQTATELEASTQAISLPEWEAIRRIIS